MSPSKQIVDKLQNISQALVRQTDQVLQERLGVGLSQLKIMNLLLDNPDSSQRQLANSLNQTEASISRQIKLMQERGWLQTTTDPTERRKHLAKLAPAGQKLTLAAQEIASEQQQKLCQKLNLKQQVALLDLLQNLKVS